MVNKTVVALLAVIVVTNVLWAYVHFANTPKWVEVYSWEGIGSSPKVEYPQTSFTSQHFQISGEKWWIDYDFKNFAGTCVSKLNVVDVYTGKVVKSVVLTLTNNTRIFLNLKGRFYLELQFSGDFESWTVDVWQLV